MACLLCQRQHSKVYRIGIREDPTRPVYECSFCGLVYIEPKIADVRSYYRDQYRKSYNATPGKAMTPKERGQFQYDFAKRSFEEFSKEVPEGSSVLDIGCSAGGFLARLEGKYDLFGNEWNPDDAAYVRSCGIPCEEGELAEVFPGRTFTAISAIHVLEHQPDPLAFLRTIRERLIGGGWLYLEIPNLRDALISMYDVPAYRDFYFREPHITYWKAETLASLLNVAGFEARIHWHQRYTLHNHVNWIMNGTPMEDPRAARTIMHPVPKSNPGAAALNRIWDQVENEYRVQMETLFTADCLRAICRRRQI